MPEQGNGRMEDFMTGWNSAGLCNQSASGNKTVHLCKNVDF